jgi:hypothetical protein
MTLKHDFMSLIYQSIQLTNQVYQQSKYIFILLNFNYLFK